VPAITRGMAVMRLVSRSPAPLTLKVIAESLGLVPSTALHIVRALVAEEMLQVDPQTKQYRLGVGILPLARSLLQHSDVPNLARPKLDELSRRHGVTAIAAEAPNLRRLIVVAIASAPTMVRLQIDVGSRLPALVSSVGRCVAAFGGYPTDQVKDAFNRLPRERPPYETWRKQVETTRRQGFNIDRQYIAGLTLVAVPVLGARGVMSHVLGAAGISSQLDRDHSLLLAEDMRAAARSIESQLLSRS
jgi:DNA-binding IclR family transcriptional regulator